MALARPALVALILTTFAAGCTGGADRPGQMNPTTYRLLEEGTAALQRYEFEQALALTDSAEQHTPNLPDAVFLRGKILGEMARYADAEAAYARVIELRPDYPGAWNNYGNSAFRQGRFSEAIGRFRRELALAPTPYPWRGIARAYRELSKPDSAQWAFERALALDSTYLAARVDLAQHLEEEGAYEEALDHARIALRLDTASVEARYLAGVLLVRTGRPAEAIPHLAVVRAAWPWHHAAEYNYGQALARLGREAEARPHLARAETLRAAEARIKNLEQLVEKVPDDPYHHAALASALRLAGRYDEALHAYRAALQQAPDNLEFHNNLAVLHLVRGEPEAAAAQLREALRRDPDFVEGWLNLGIVYVKSGRPAEARRAWETVVRLQPEHPQARVYLAGLAQQD